MVLQAQQLLVQLNYLHLKIVYVVTGSESKSSYTDCRDFLLIRRVDIAFTFRNPLF